MFRHALMRDAAYELQPPAQRAALHAHALEIIEQAFADDDTALDAQALELANHAAAAGEPRGPFGARECEWLMRAAKFAHNKWRVAEAASLYARAAGHPAIDGAERMRAIGAQGMALVELGNMHAAIEVLGRSADEADVSEEVLRPLCYACRNIGRLDDALRYARRVVVAAEAGGNAEQLALALDAEAMALFAMNRTAEALPVAQAACAHAAASGNARVHGGIMANLGVVQTRACANTEVIATLRAALAILEVTLDRRTTAAVRRNLADRMRVTGPSMEAVHECTRALHEMRALGDRRGEAMALLTLGGLHDELGDPVVAIEILQQSMDRLRETGDMGILSFAQATLARALRNSGRADEARPAALEALTLAQSSGSGPGVAFSALVLGDIAREARCWRDAAEWYRRAHEGYQAISDYERAAVMLAEAAHAMLQAGGDAENACAQAAEAMRAHAPNALQRYQDKWRAARAKS